MGAVSWSFEPEGSKKKGRGGRRGTPGVSPEDCAEALDDEDMTSKTQKMSDEGEGILRTWNARLKQWGAFKVPAKTFCIKYKCQEWIDEFAAPPHQSLDSRNR